MRGQWGQGLIELQRIDWIEPRRHERACLDKQRMTLKSDKVCEWRGE